MINLKKTTKELEGINFVAFSNAVLILSHSELFDYGCIPVMYPSTNELSLLWKGNKKLKKCLFVPIKGPDYELTVNMFTGEVVEYVDMDIIEGNFN